MDKFALARMQRDDRIRLLARLAVAKKNLEDVKGYLERVVIPHERMNAPPEIAADGGTPGANISSGAEAAQVAEIGLSA